MLRSLAIFATTLLSSIQNLEINSTALAADPFDASEISGLPAAVDASPGTELAQVGRFAEYKELKEKTLIFLNRGMTEENFLDALAKGLSAGVLDIKRYKAIVKIYGI